MACNSYNTMYSSANYDYANKYLEYSLGVLLKIAKDFGIPFDGIEVEYCGYLKSVDDFKSLDELLDYL